MQFKNRRTLKRICLTVMIVFLSNIFLIMPLATGIVYEVIFHSRFETVSWMKREVAEYERLSVKECTFSSNNGQMLTGYRYDKKTEHAKGVVVLSHGLGCGGQNVFISVSDYFAENGYFVFGYDATGNGKSEGADVNGLPQGVADLDYALRYVKSLPEYQGLPLFLFGHSWGGYSAGAVLEFHPDVKGVVLLSAPNDSLSLMIYESTNYVGFLAYPQVPYLMLYEYLKFGSYASVSAMEGFASSESSVMIVQSMDDEAVPPEIGYDVFLDAYRGSPRFTFVSYEDRGHDFVYCSAESFKYRKTLNEAYLHYTETQELEHSAETKEAFMEYYSLDKKKCYEPDPLLLSQILQFFDTNAA